MGLNKILGETLYKHLLCHEILPVPWKEESDFGVNKIKSEYHYHIQIPAQSAE